MKKWSAGVFAPPPGIGLTKWTCGVYCYLSASVYYLLLLICLLIQTADKKLDQHIKPKMNSWEDELIIKKNPLMFIFIIVCSAEQHWPTCGFVWAFHLLHFACFVSFVCVQKKNFKSYHEFKLFQSIFNYIKQFCHSLLSILLYLRLAQSILEYLGLLRCILVYLH